MPDAITQLIADLKESKYSQAQQNIIVPVDDFVAALNEIEIEIAIGGALTITDGTNTVAGTTSLTVTGGTVGGTTPNATLDISGGAGYLGIPQNSQSADYTTVLGDSGKHILHPLADNNPRTFTIDSNANVAYPIGTVIVFVNQVNTLSIAITSDTMTLAGGSSTGTRTLAAYGIASALKTDTTGWIIAGTNLT